MDEEMKIYSSSTTDAPTQRENMRVRLHMRAAGQLPGVLQTFFVVSQFLSFGISISFYIAIILSWP